LAEKRWEKVDGCGHQAESGLDEELRKEWEGMVRMQGVRVVWY
jgi:hypothetical protein